MFEEMAVLVDAQGEMLDAIEARWTRQPAPACIGGHDPLCKLAMRFM